MVHDYEQAHLLERGEFGLERGGLQRLIVHSHGLTRLRGLYGAVSFVVHSTTRSVPAVPQANGWRRAHHKHTVGPDHEETVT